MGLPRSCGILLHLTSLPGRFGIGDLGPESENFLDFLAETGQRWWQMLPVGPTGHGHSPYQSPSSFAGNPLLISPERLAIEGYLTPKDWSDEPSFPAGKVEFDAVSGAKSRLLRRAFANFGVGDEHFATFRRENATWLDDYALFMALKDAHDGADLDRLGGGRRRPEAGGGRALAREAGRGSALLPVRAVLLRSPVDPPAGTAAASATST